VLATNTVVVFNDGNVLDINDGNVLATNTLVRNVIATNTLVDIRESLHLSMMNNARHCELVLSCKKLFVVDARCPISLFL